jgi:hypothetical protein
MQLQAQLQELGPSPRRQRRSMEEMQSLHVAATAAVARDEARALPSFQVNKVLVKYGY